MPTAGTSLGLACHHLHAASTYVLSGTLNHMSLAAIFPLRPSALVDKGKKLCPEPLGFPVLLFLPDLG